PEPTPDIPLGPTGNPIYSTDVADLYPFGEDLLVKPDGTPYVFATTYIFVMVDPMAKYVGNMHNLIERAGGEFLTFDPNLDPQKQIAFVEDCAAVTKPDAILMQPMNEALLAPAADKAWAAGIPVFSWDFDLYSDHTVCTIHDHFRGDFGSNLIGEYLVNIAESEDKQINVFEIWGDMSVDSSHARHEGFHSAVDGHPLITVTESGDLGWTSVELCSTYVMDAFTANPELNATYQHGGGCAGSIEGLRAIDLLLPIGDPNHVIIATNDSDSAGMLEMDNGFLDAFLNHGGWHISDVTPKIAMTYVCLGQPVPRFADLPLFVNTPDTVDNTYFFGACPAYPRMPQDFSLWPVLDYSTIGIETPTSAMKGTDYNPTANYASPTQATYDASIVTFD
ncbi:MAG: sugar ABC transporter substrate-binding protein, partial [Dehalococcoidia bacterium]|nr:sugar ABC transporter substrate-binding protein [Dehalococcoidia bacterium]